MACTHEPHEQDTAAQADGLCPLCLQNSNARMRVFMERALEACRNSGRGNEIVAERVIERVEEELLSGLGREGYDA